MPTRPPRRERRIESLSLILGAGAFVIVALLAMIVFRFQPAAIAGQGSIGQFAAVCSGAVAVVAFVTGDLFVKRGRRGFLGIVDLAALAFAHGVIAVLTWTLASVILEDAFFSAEVFALPVIVLSGAVAAVTAYVAFLSATHMDLTLLAILLAVFLIEGMLASMLTASDPLWWHEHLSSLGATRDISSLTFNLTLVVAGVMVTTLARAATAGVPTSRPAGTARVRLCLILIGVFLALVGVFQVDDFFWLHTGFASGMAVVYGVLVIRLPVWVPDISRSFVLLGWVFFGVLLLLGVLYGVGYYTLTAVELVGGTLVFTWIILFLRNAAAVQHDLTR
ncbi:hypothetical protein G5T42_05935 [Microbacterium sp. 4R-513]|uniref:hypothetical protein n=1 Tax=Microbacterium sp. 4R-513 TaxID=2567934 RepID=UPI0013E182D2|nr:hypothetical protein [Microbacterium sp. 4R-513]QIG39085.1 hypothetical protein G5T42_05935 [Microbacterium sp. 4R-513]